jgi:hypothetical protein
MFQEIKERIQREARRVNASVSIFALLLLLWLLYDIYRENTGSGEPIGKVTQRVNKVNRKFNFQSIWNDLKVQAEVYKMDTIRTDENSKLIILFDDQTEIEIDENSMVVLNFSSGSLDLNLVNGGLNLNSLNSSAKSVKVKSGDSEIQMDKGAMKIDKSYDSMMNVNVLEGKAEYAKGETRQDILKNEELKVRGEKVQKSLKKFRLIQPRNSRIFLTSKQQEAIFFEWDGEEEGYILEIFSLSGNIKKVLEQRLSSNSFSKELPFGKYSWKLSDLQRTETLTEIFYVSDNNPVRPLTPVEGALFSYSDELPKISFSWSKNEFNPLYQLEISKTRDFLSTEVRLDSTSESTVIDTLGEGKYFYRILSKVDATDTTPKISRTHSFTIQKNKGPEKPELLSPKHKEQIALKDKLRFSWKKQPEFSHFRIQISKDSGFASVFKIQETEDNTMEWQESFSEDEYFWRVEGKVKGTQTWVSSEIRNFVVTSSPRANFAINLESPKNGEEIGKDKVSFTWKGNLEKPYILELSDTTSFQKIIRTIETKKSGQVLPTLDPGEYYWRVKSLVEEDFTVYSEAFSFYVVNLQAPVIEIPKSPAEFDVLKTKTAVFRWKKQENALSYALEVWQDKEKLISESTKRTEWQIDDLTVFQPKNYTFRLVANTLGREGKIIQTQPATVNFKVFLSKTIKKEDIQFKTPETIYIE